MVAEYLHTGFSIRIVSRLEAQLGDSCQREGGRVGHSETTIGLWKWEDFIQVASLLYCQPPQAFTQCPPSISFRSIYPTWWKTLLGHPSDPPVSSRNQPQLLRSGGTLLGGWHPGSHSWRHGQWKNIWQGWTCPVEKTVVIVLTFGLGQVVWSQKDHSSLRLVSVPSAINESLLYLTWTCTWAFFPTPT